MNNNFHEYINPFERVNIVNKLMNAIDREFELTLIYIDGKLTKIYELIPKVFKYKDHNFYIKCDINNENLWIKYNGFDIIDNKILGIFDNIDDAKEELASFLER